MSKDRKKERERLLMSERQARSALHATEACQAYAEALAALDRATATLKNTPEYHAWWKTEIRLTEHIVLYGDPDVPQPVGFLSARTHD